LYNANNGTQNVIVNGGAIVSLNSIVPLRIQYRWWYIHMLGVLCTKVLEV